MIVIVSFFQIFQSGKRISALFRVTDICAYNNTIKNHNLWDRWCLNKPLYLWKKKKTWLLLCFIIIMLVYSLIQYNSRK